MENRRITRNLARFLAQQNLQNLSRANHSNRRRTLESIQEESEFFGFRIDELCSNWLNSTTENENNIENMATNNDDVPLIDHPEGEEDEEDSNNGNDSVEQQLYNVTAALESLNKLVMEGMSQMNAMKEQIHSLETRNSIDPQSVPVRNPNQNQNNSNRSGQPRPPRPGPPQPGPPQPRPPQPPPPVPEPRSQNRQYDKKFNDLSKWNIKFDGTGKDLTAESFIFRIERLAAAYSVSHEKLFTDLHLCLTGNAAKWYWQLIEDHHNDGYLNYGTLKNEFLRYFKSTENDYEIIKEIVERKQQVGESFDDFYTDIHNLSFRLQTKLPEQQLVKIIKSNLRGNLAMMLFSSNILTLSDLQRECRKAEKVWKDTRPTKNKVVNEIEFDVEAPCSSHACVNVEAIEQNKNRVPQKPFDRNPQQQQQQKPFNNANRFENKTNLKNETAAKLCPSPFHLNLCFVCGMPADHFRKNVSSSSSESCKCTFHIMKWFMCGNNNSYCAFDTKLSNSKPDKPLNHPLAEVAGGQSQLDAAPDK